MAFSGCLVNQSLKLNHKSNIALFFDDNLGFVPEWVSLDIDCAQIFIGDEGHESKLVQLGLVEEFSDNKPVEQVAADCNEEAPNYDADACIAETLRNDWQEFKVHAPLTRP